MLVAVRPGLDRAEVEQLAARHGGRIERWLPRLGLALFVAPGGSAATFAADLESDDRVDFAGPHIPLARAADTPVDEHWGQQWGMVKVNGPGAWDLAWGKAGEPIAIIDSGVQHQHLDLRGQIWFNPGESALDAGTRLRSCDAPLAYNGLDDDGNGYVDDCRGYDFSARDNDPRDQFGHGTVVAGIAAAATNNPDPYVAGGYEGVAGMARQASIMALRALDEYGKGYAIDLAEAIDYAAAKGARVINLSFTFPPQTAGNSPDVLAVQRAVADAQAAGALIVAAAGNENYSGIDYPAKLPGVLAVGASTSADERAGFSNYGARLDLLAPGASIFGPLMQPGLSSYGYFNSSGNGTSFAAPHVAGVAALVRGLRPDLGQAQVYDLLLHTARDLGAPGFDGATGWGRLDAAAAVAEAVKGLSLELRADPPGVAVGAAVSVSARVRGPGGEVAGAGARITFSTTGGAVAPQTATADGSGEAKATLTAPQSTGGVTVGARLGGLTASLPVTVSSGIPTVITLDPSPAAIPVGGTSEIVAEVRDEEGNQVGDGVGVTFKTTLGSVSPSAATTASGKARTHFTAPSAAGQAIVSAAAGNVSGSRTLPVVGAGTAFSMTLTAAPASGEADGPPVTLNARVWDGVGAAVPDGSVVQFTTDLGQVMPTQSLTKNGLATTQLRPPSQIGVAHVAAAAGYAAARLDVTIAAGLATTVTVTATPETLVAGYNRLAQITASPVDRRGNPLPDGAQISFTTTLGQVVPAVASVTGSRAAVQLIGGLTAGQAQVTAQAPGGASGSVRVTIAPDQPRDLIFDAAPKEIATGGQIARLKVMVHDAYSNPVAAGTAVTFTTDLGGLREAGGGGPGTAVLRVGTVAGVAQADLVSGSNPGVANVRAEVDGVPAKGLQIHIQAGAAASVMLTVQPALVRPGGRLEILASVVDRNGNPVADGTMVSFAASRGVLDQAAVPTDAGIAYTWLAAPQEPGQLQIVALVGAISSFKYATVAAGGIWLPLIQQ